MKIYRIKEAASFLNCTEKTIYNLMSRGLLPKEKHLGHYYFLEEDLLVKNDSWYSLFCEATELIRLLEDDIDGWRSIAIDILTDLETGRLIYKK
jgi:hypothetical protein